MLKIGELVSTQSWYPKPYSVRVQASEQLLESPLAPIVWEFSESPPVPPQRLLVTAHVERRLQRELGS